MSVGTGVFWEEPEVSQVPCYCTSEQFAERQKKKKKISEFRKEHLLLIHVFSSYFHFSVSIAPGLNLFPFLKVTKQNTVFGCKILLEHSILSD